MGGQVYLNGDSRIGAAALAGAVRSFEFAQPHGFKAHSRRLRLGRGAGLFCPKASPASVLLRDHALANSARKERDHG
jgi:hypothetical protein